jgi:hypothetical protein
MMGKLGKVHRLVTVQDDDGMECLGCFFEERHGPCPKGDDGNLCCIYQDWVFKLQEVT